MSSVALPGYHVFSLWEACAYCGAGRDFDLRFGRGVTCVDCHLELESVASIVRQEALDRRAARQRALQEAQRATLVERERDYSPCAECEGRRFAGWHRHGRSECVDCYVEGVVDAANGRDIARDKRLEVERARARNDACRVGGAYLWRGDLVRVVAKGPPGRVHVVVKTTGREYARVMKVKDLETCPKVV